MGIAFFIYARVFRNTTMEWKRFWCS